MAVLSKKTIDRFSKNVSKFQGILRLAKDRDVNESDTVSIITDILADVLGYDKYLEITRELAIRSTYCDLAIKVDNNIQYLIEAKAIGIELKENHLRQAIDYGANHGIPWVILTNGISWEIYKIRFEKPINYDLVCSFNFLEINHKKEVDQEKLFIISKEGLSKDAREDFHEKVQSFNRFIVGAIILNENVVNTIKKELKKLNAGIKVDNDQIQKMLSSEVLKRDVIEGDEAIKAQARMKRFYKKQESAASKIKVEAVSV
ncbi:MAG: hypothetical protein A2X42_09015 [Candidatus Margulisbacteria bacterium GWF2_38_17]|nr:MAG: hypothetical protein A2X43_03335 [Candidatus Margulisbacteria bacterium GWD2_39_127]OGI04022.1 MAG: hypothetical protein A2X42_09015 [Candidatus Margulisbacteria bacterium GWF2_38_17]OGI11986.1 MAG: hypothetical protein A2X41_02980 [Candidatus Margulisbacteria bacterium GWE2_39_32]